MNPSFTSVRARSSGEDPGPVESLRDVLAIESRGEGELPQSTYEMLRRAAERYPDRRALSFFLRAKEHRRPQVWTYGELFGDITRAANFFHDLGAGKEGVVASILPNLPESHLTFWGGQAAGVSFPINPLLEPQAIGDLLVAAEAHVVVTVAPFPGTDLWQKVQSVLARVPSVHHVVLVDLATRVRGLSSVVARVLQRRQELRLHGWAGVRRAVPAHVRVHEFWRGLRAQPADRLASGRVIRAGDRSSFLCTGGTTGAPKIAIRTHANEVRTTSAAAAFFGDRIDESKNFFCGLPLFHAVGLYVTGLLPFSRGAHVLLGTPQGYRGEGVIAGLWEIMEHHRIHYISGVPTLYAALLQVPAKPMRPRSLEYAISGSASMPVGLMRTFEQRTGAKILEGYGLTEGTFLSSCNPMVGERRVGSVGLRMPHQSLKVVVVNDEDRYVRDCAAGEEGVIVISGPNVFAGYRDPKHEKGTWLDLADGRTWLNTGDMGRLDADGYLFITGRKKDLIIRGGHNIDPLAIEEVLAGHPAVQLCAAIGRPDAYAGELPVAYVQLKPAATAKEEELRAFARGRIGERAAHPAAIRIVDELPLTAVGKIFKPTLRHREARDVLLDALRAAKVDVLDVVVGAGGALGTLATVTIAREADEPLASEALAKFACPFCIVVGRPVPDGRS